MLNGPIYVESSVEWTTGRSSYPCQTGDIGPVQLGRGRMGSHSASTATSDDCPPRAPPFDAAPPTDQ